MALGALCAKKGSSASIYIRKNEGSYSLWMVKNSTVFKDKQRDRSYAKHKQPNKRLKNTLSRNMMGKGWQNSVRNRLTRDKNEDLADSVMRSRMYSRESRHDFRSVYVWVFFVPVQDKGAILFHEKKETLQRNVYYNYAILRFWPSNKSYQVLFIKLEIALRYCNAQIKFTYDFFF